MQDQNFLAALQAQYGSWIVGGVQVVRYAYYSKQTYSTAGSTSYSFFGDVVGQNGVTEFTTNMTRANSFSQRDMLIRAIRTQLYFPASTIKVAAAAVTTGYLGMLHDVSHSASLLRLKIQDKEYLKIAEPLLYMPFGSGIDSAVASYSLASAADGSMSYGVIGPRKDDVFIYDPPQLIESEVVFNLTIEYNAAVSVTTAGVIAVFLDGIVFRGVS